MKEEEDDLVRVVVDADVDRWIQLPPDELNARVWARQMAHAWAAELGRLNDKNWESVFELMLLTACGQVYSDPPDEIFLHVLTPPNQAPDIGIALLNVLRVNDPAAAVADDLAAGSAADCVEPPTRTTVGVARDLVETVLCHFRVPEGEVRTQLFAVRKVQDEVVVVLTATADDIDRILLMRDDMVTLAQQVRLAFKADT